ncbi:LutC/YkgG family protein [Lentibacillus cibarius]|uniref:Lactate utilization protein C n=1 Tax=Lentibacillus cibarius TaxID=2583219 RepID=A0A5S3QJ15_9BACI|nr:lactate utilization protein C [Lentibacillus cibarius]TMN21719.1 lactate utilization protein C [Lentibacillus cibarius]
MSKGTIHNRDKFLSHIADRLGREQKTDVSRPDWKYQPQWAVYQEKTSDELCALFNENSEEKGTHVLETTMDQLEETVEYVMKTYDGSPMVATDDERFAEFGLTDVFDKNNVHIWDAESGERNIEKAKQANIGFLFSDVSLAESGTIAQFNDRNIARSVSLLPTTYTAFIPKSTIVPRMTQVTARIHKQGGDGENISPYINFITGPSNSADIEMNMVVGVHGPVKAVHIVILDA